MHGGSQETVRNNSSSTSNILRQPLDSCNVNMMEVLASKHGTKGAHGGNFSPRQSMPVGVDSTELIGTAFSQPSIDPALCSRINEACPTSSEPPPQRRQNQEIRHEGGVSVELSVLALVIEAIRRSGMTCQGSMDDIKMEIGWPTNVRHVAHVTFDRFNGFLGLPVEFQMEVSRRVPSASASVFGVSAESMQCSFDGKGNSVPTILLLLQERLCEQGGLKAEGIFSINAENSQEEYVREQVNHGIIPHGIDVHCLAGLIKAWFRELPRGVLDSLSPEQVMECHTEEQALLLMKTLPPMQGALLDWAINLMADVVQEEHYNTMNAHNIAMVFAPNMTQMSDPLTALMHAVQVMNLLKTLILRTIRDREETILDPRPASSCAEPPTDSNGRDNAPQERSSGASTWGADGNGAERGTQFLRSFDGMDGVQDFESACGSEEFFAVDMHRGDSCYEAELSSDSQWRLSNGSSIMDTTEEGSNGVSPSSVHDLLVRSPEHSGVAAGSAQHSLNSYIEKASPLATMVLGKMESLSLEGDEYIITEFLNLGGLESAPNRGQIKGCVVDQIDQFSERVEAW